MQVKFYSQLEVNKPYDLHIHSIHQLQFPSYLSTKDNFNLDDSLTNTSVMRGKTLRLMTFVFTVRYKNL